VFRVLSSLANAAMNRLIKGTENSLSASSEMFSKHNCNQTGDLAVNIKSRGGGLLMLSSRGDYIESDVDVQTDDLDFSLLLPLPPISPMANQNQPIVRYSHIKIACIYSLADLDNQIRQMEFRNVFRLSYSETIVTEETPCYYFVKTGGTSYTGNLYLSQSFINFCSLGTVLTTNMTNSMLFDSSLDPALIFTIPYSHIVSVQKQSPTSLMSLSGYLAISTKNRYEFSLSFSSIKARDRVMDMVLSRIKTVDWNFDEDVIIGGRNGPLNAQKKLVGDSSSLDGKNDAINTILSQNPPKHDILLTGLSFLIPHKEKSGNIPMFLSNDKTSIKWAEYFDAYVLGSNDRERMFAL
jgi:hypothetical protein